MTITVSTSTRKSVSRMLAHAQQLLCMRKLYVRAEKGSMDGGNTADIEYIPFLAGLLLFGLVVALVGFYRVGASYSTQFAAQAGSLSADQGNPALAAIWSAWTNGNAPAEGFVQDETTRSVSASIRSSKSINLGIFGTFDFDISSGSGLSVREERFYPGQPACPSPPCNE